MTPEAQIVALATLQADMKHVVTAVDNLTAQVKELVTRSEFESLRAKVEAQSARAVMARITSVATTITSVAAAVVVILALLGHIKL